MNSWKLRFTLLVGIACSVPADGSIINGGFETGDLSGWEVLPSSLAWVVGSQWPVGYGPGDPARWYPTDGDYFAYLRSGAGAGVYTLLSQGFAAAPGDDLSLDVFFDTGDSLPWNDDAYVDLLNASCEVIANLYVASVETVGRWGADGWTDVHYGFTSGGTYHLRIGVRNMGDNAGPSAIGIDSVSVSTPALLGHSPEPSGLLIWFLLGTFGMAVGWWRRRRKSV